MNQIKCSYSDRLKHGGNIFKTMIMHDKEKDNSLEFDVSSKQLQVTYVLGLLAYFETIRHFFGPSEMQTASKKRIETIAGLHF